MIEKKKIIALALTLVVSTTMLIGCSNAKRTKAEKTDTQTVSQENGNTKSDEENENGLIGTWVIENYDIDITPPSEFLTPFKEYYAIGTDIEYTKDKMIYKKANENLGCKIITDTTYELTLKDGHKDIYHYKIDGNSLTLYFNITDGSGKLIPDKYWGSVILKRK